MNAVTLALAALTLVHALIAWLAVRRLRLRYARSGHVPAVRPTRAAGVADEPPNACTADIRRPR